jgi:hypothetical protein
MQSLARIIERDDCDPEGTIEWMEALDGVVAQVLSR